MQNTGSPASIEPKTKTMDEPGRVPATQLRTMQIIAAALVMGVSAFVAFAVFQRLTGPARPNDEHFDVLPWVSLGMLVMGLLVGFFLGRNLEQTALRNIRAGSWKPPEGMGAETFLTTESKLLATRQTSLIVRLALLEGPAFVGGFAYLQSGSLLGLGVALAGIALLVAHFPTRGGLERWLDEQMSEPINPPPMSNQ